MRINVDAGSFGLFEQFFQILQIMAGYQNRLAFDRGDANRRRHGVSVGAGVRFIEQFHDPDVDFAAAQSHAQQGIHTEVRLGQEVERLVEERVDLRVLLVKDPGVVGVSGHAFQTVYDQVFQADQVGAASGDFLVDGNGLALGDQAVQIGGRRPGGRAGECFGNFAGFQRGGFIESFGFGLDFGALADDSRETLGIEVDVGDGGKQCFDDIFVNGRILGAEHGGAVGVHRYSLGDIQQQVLQGRCFGVFAADAEHVAAGPFGGLFTLITKHSFLPPIRIFVYLQSALNPALQSVPADKTEPD